MGLLPEKGSGAGWNLATVSYVNQSSGDLEKRIVDRVLAELPGNMESLLAEDRKRVTGLQDRALAQENQIERMQSDLEETRTLVADLTESLQAQTEAFRNAAREVRATTTRLDSAIQELPSETLRQLRAALDGYLAEREAGAPPPDTEAGDAEDATGGGAPDARAGTP
jgi:chromosome segregation ATPase